jgi:hypothetical protein
MFLTTRVLCTNYCNSCHYKAVQGFSALRFAWLTVKPCLLRLANNCHDSCIIFQSQYFLAVVVTHGSLLTSLEVKIEEKKQTFDWFRLSCYCNRNQYLTSGIFVWNMDLLLPRFLQMLFHLMAVLYIYELLCWSLCPDSTILHFQRGLVLCARRLVTHSRPAPEGTRSTRVIWSQLP